MCTVHVAHNEKDSRRRVLFQGQLDLKEMSCLGGHLRALSAEEICGTYVAAAAPAVDAPDQSRRQRDLAALPAWRSRRPGQRWGAGTQDEARVLF